MVTWLPASVSIMQKIPNYFEKINLSQRLHKSISQKGLIIENFIINVVSDLPILWILFFGKKKKN